MSDVNDGEGTVDLFKLVSTVWDRRLLVFVCMCVSVLLVVLYLHVAVRLYTATMMVVPANNQSSQQGLKMGGGLGAVASLAGIDLGGKGRAQSPFDAYQLAIATHETAAAMLARPDITSVIYDKQWDFEKNTWKPYVSPLKSVTDPIKWILGIPLKPWQPPSPTDMVKFIKTKVAVNADKDTGAVTLSYDNADPRFAEKFLWALHTTIDSAIRAKTARESAEYISYISERLKVVTVTEQRTALADLLSSEEQRATLAGSKLPYAADVFSAPLAPPKPTKPSPVLFVFLGMVLGAAFGAFWAIAAEYLGRGRRNAPAPDIASL